MRPWIALGLLALGCGGGGLVEVVDAGAPAADAPAWDCWGEPVSSEWTADTTWQAVTGAGDYGTRTERVRTRGS